MMKKLNNYIFGHFFVALSFFTFALAGMFWLAQSVALIDEVVLRGEGVLTFFTLSVRLLPAILLNILPVASLASSLYFLNQLATQGELVVMNAAGVNPLRLGRPIAFLGLLATIFLLGISLFVAPRANYQIRQTVFEIAENFSVNIVQSGQFMFPVSGVTIFANESLQSGEMVDLFIEDRRQNPLIRSYFSERGFFQRSGSVIQIALINGDIHEHNVETGDISRAHFGRTEVNFEIDKALDSQLGFWINEKPTRQLWEEVQADKVNNAKSLGELVHRVFYPLLTFILPSISALIFLSAPYSRHGYGRPILTATVIGLLLTAFQMAVPSNVQTNTSLAWFTLVPLLVLIITYFYARKRISS